MSAQGQLFNARYQIFGVCLLVGFALPVDVSDVIDAFMDDDIACSTLSKNIAAKSVPRRRRCRRLEASCFR